MESECTICFDFKPLEGFLLLPCGHGFCITCMDSLSSHANKCPLCRRTFKKRGEVDARPIRLEIIDGTTNKANRVVHRMKSINSASTSSEISGLAGQVEDTLQDAHKLESDTLVAIHQSLESLTATILPKLRELEEINQQIRELRELNNAVELLNQELQNEFRACQGRLFERDREVDRALRQRDEYKSHVATLRSELSDLKISLDIEKQQRCLAQEETNTVIQDRSRYIGYLDKQRLQCDKLKTKLKAQEAKVAQLMEGLESQSLFDTERTQSRWERSDDDIHLDRTSSPGPGPDGAIHDMTNEDRLLFTTSSFHSDWRAGGAMRSGLKRKISASSSHARDVDGGVIQLKNGRPLQPIQLGPKRSKRFTGT